MNLKNTDNIATQEMTIERAIEIKQCRTSTFYRTVFFIVLLIGLIFLFLDHYLIFACIFAVVILFSVIFRKYNPDMPSRKEVLQAHQILKNNNINLRNETDLH